MEYKIFDPKVNGPLHTLTGKDAHIAYRWFLANIPSRIEELSNLLNGFAINLDFTEQSLTELHGWFIKIVQDEKKMGRESPSSELFSICNDIGIYIAEMVMQCSSKIRWELFIADPKGVSYQRPVIAGFNVKNKDYHVDFDYLICQYAFRIMKYGKSDDNLFVAMFLRAKSIS